MEKKAKFRVELEIEVEYNVPEEAEGITPYTAMQSSLQDGVVSFRTDIGKIIDYYPVKFDRAEEYERLSK